jgi:hypothetical protein
LLFVDQYATAGLCNQGKRHFELLPAIAAERAKDITGEALRVDAHQRRHGMDVAQYQSHCRFRPPVTPYVTLKTHDAEMSPSAWKIGLG